MRAPVLCLLIALVGAGCSSFDEPVDGVGVRICGNGTIEPGEACDDGNNVTEACPWGEGACTVCDANCDLVPGVPTFCGDGILQLPHETCDDGNAVTESCPYGEACVVCAETCTSIAVFRYCGDGVIDEDGGEVCDDGDENSATTPDACRPDCRLPTCGDGIIDSGEECEPGRDDRCREDCVLMRCGDGVLDPGEECDPGLDPECRPDCVSPRCGDGIVQTGETCDLGEVAVADIAWRPGVSCVLDVEGKLRCAGDEAIEALPAMVDSGVLDVTVGDGFACAIVGAPWTDTGPIVCWGQEPVGDPHRPVLAPPGGRFRDLAAGDAHVCAIDENGVADCWGSIDTREITQRVGFRSVGSGRGFSCARHYSGDVECWGSRAFGIFDRPPGFFATLAVGTRHVCARDQNLGTTICWGEDTDGKTVVPEGVHLDGFALGDQASCALDELGRPICWGAPLWPPPPDGSFERLIAAGRGVCGLRDGALHCWGQDVPPLPVNADGVPGACRGDCQPARCGDGVVDPGEDCDGGEGCTDDCQAIGHCGDGVVQPATETCDDGNAITETCPWNTSCVVCDASCQLRPGAGPRCGDGMHNGAEEACDDGDAGIPFTAIAMGDGHGCGLLPDGTLRCWGALEGPEGADWIDVAASADFACGLRGDGSIACWGGRADPPQEGLRFQRIVAAGTGLCALDEIGAIHCWGGPRNPPAGAGHVALDIGLHAGCAIDAAGSLSCWGPLPAPPEGTFVDVALGTFQACAIDTDERLRCWGGDAAPEVGHRRMLAVDGDGPICAVDAAGQAFCFGSNAQAPPVGSYVDVAMVGAGGCLVGEDGLLSCWPSQVPRPPHNTNRQTIVACREDCSLPTCGDFIRDPWEECDAGPGTPPWDTCEYDRACPVCSAACTMVTGVRPHCGDGVIDEPEACDDGGIVEAVGLGDDFACILHGDGRPRCWGADGEGQSTAPYGTYDQLAVGRRHVCATDQGGLPWCWGASDLGQGDAPRVLLQAIEAGTDFTCGLDPGGAIVCWGDVPFLPPTGTWVEIGAGDRHLCARDEAGMLACWGADDRGQASPPFGSYDRLAVGSDHGCARDLLGEVICWGENAAGQATPPADLEADWIAAGDLATCAGTQASIVCWGAIGNGEPSGPLAQLALQRWGGGASCGIDTDQRLVCAGLSGALASELPPFNDDTLPGACRSDCRPAHCGDGVVDPGEACDDGNTDDGDGCSSTCQTE